MQHIPNPGVKRRPISSAVYMDAKVSATKPAASVKKGGHVIWAAAAKRNAPVVTPFKLPTSAPTFNA